MLLIKVINYKGPKVHFSYLSSFTPQTQGENDKAKDCIMSEVRTTGWPISMKHTLHIDRQMDRQIKSP